MISVLIVDDHAIVRKAIRSAFELIRGLVVCGEAVDGQDAIDKAQTLHPDAVVLDLSMPRLNGLEAARILRRLMPAVPLFMLTAHCSPELTAMAQRSGIREVFAKTGDLTPLIDDVRSAATASDQPPSPTQKG